MRAFATLVCAFIMVAGCHGPKDDGGGDDDGPVTFIISGVTVSEVLYQLQDLDPDAVRTSGHDLVIMDYSGDGSHEMHYSHDDIGSISVDRIILCYLSVGEAEDYRYYWNVSWGADADGVPDPDAPEWLDAENPDWDGNYKVRYWMQGWRDIIFEGNDSYLGWILEAGFDGVYLDLVDAYEGYEDARPSARSEMIDLVIDIAGQARRVDPNFLVVPQNAEPLGTDPTYLSAVDGIGREEVFFIDDVLNTETATIMEDLTVFLDASRFVIDVEYCTGRNVARASEMARDNGYLQFIGGRDLDTMP